MTGTPTQAMKFAIRLNNGMGMRFMADFMAGKDMSAWKITTGAAVDTSRVVPGHLSFPEFCRLNPDEPERAELMTYEVKGLNRIYVDPRLTEGISEPHVLICKMEVKDGKIIKFIFNEELEYYLTGTNERMHTCSRLIKERDLHPNWPVAVGSEKVGDHPLALSEIDRVKKLIEETA